MTVNALDGFASDIVRAAPEVVAALEASGESRSPDHDLPTLWLGSVGTAIAAVFYDLPPERRNTVLGVVERLLGDPSGVVRTAVATGLLEELASAVSSGRLAGADLAAVLGPRSRAYLDQWDAFTLGRSSLGDPE